jgi:hypothetical protein
MKATDNTARKDEQHMSITGVASQVRAESENQDPVLREIELNAMLHMCDLLSRTGIVRIPAIIVGAVMAERDRVSILADLQKS